MTPGASEFQPGGIGDPGDQRLDLSALGAQQGFLEGLSTRPVASQDDLDADAAGHGAGSLNGGDCLCGVCSHFLAASAPLLLGHLAEEVRGQLVCGVVGAALGLTQADVARRHGEDGVAAGLCEGQVHVVFVGVDIEVVGFRAADFRVLGLDGVLLRLRRQLLAQAFAEPAEVARSCRRGFPQGIHDPVLCLWPIAAPWPERDVTTVAAARPVDAPSLGGGLTSRASRAACVLGHGACCLCQV